MVDVEITWLKKKNYARQSSNGKSSLAGLALNSACPTMSKMEKLTVKYPLNLQAFWLKKKNMPHHAAVCRQKWAGISNIWKVKPYISTSFTGYKARYFPYMKGTRILAYLPISHKVQYILIYNSILQFHAVSPAKMSCPLIKSQHRDPSWPGLRRRQQGGLASSQK